MSVEAVEGVDYIVDLYAVAGATPDMAPDVIKQQLNERVFEYHPDRLEGLAPEFQKKGARMAVLLGRARTILLDDQKRAAYDEILDAWDGPISPDGTPVMTMARYQQLLMIGKTADEVEATLTEQFELVAATSSSESLITLLEAMMVGKSDDEIDPSINAQYDAALLQQSTRLAIQEGKRSQLLGLPFAEADDFRVPIGYGELVVGNIEAARAEQEADAKMRALGGVSTRLALLAGEEVDPAGSTQAVTSMADAYALPVFFDDQAEKVKQLAHEREEITKKRLANLRPEYPEAELQTEFRENVVIGLGDHMWLWLKIDPDTLHVEMTEMPDDISELIERGDFGAVIDHDYNVLIVEFLEMIDPTDLIRATIEKYLAKYEESSTKASESSQGQ